MALPANPEGPWHVGSAAAVRRRRVDGVQGQEEQPVGLVGAVVAGGGEGDTDDELDEIVGAQAEAGGPRLLGAGEQAACGIHDRLMAVDCGRIRLRQHEGAGQALVDACVDEEESQPGGQRVLRCLRG